MEIVLTVSALVMWLAVFVKLTGFILAKKYPNAAKWATKDLSHDFAQFTQTNQHN
ncbi:hypothetical protein SO3561_06311 [Streptomyces olivochromogenes]|uniref:Uncharacterized protein n=1 Tax=Streptomyces olivochromogenes TaxID=1963 RepID=A0A250VKM1_STROL|nr:hypothetical protein SO3561_06311 [Streptomyces olivochromogenes]